MQLRTSFLLICISTFVFPYCFSSQESTSDERSWYANRILVTIFDDIETIEDFNTVASMNKKYREYQKKLQELYKDYYANTDKIKSVEEDIDNIIKALGNFKSAIGPFLICLLEQRSTPLLVSEEILSVVLAGDGSLLKPLFEKWFCFEVSDGAYLLIPKNDRCLGDWKPGKKLNKNEPLSKQELRIGLCLDHLLLLDQNMLIKRLLGKTPSNKDLKRKKNLTDEEKKTLYERDQLFSQKQMNALYGVKGKSPLFVTSVDRKNISESSYPEQSWVIVMHGHGSTYHRKSQELIDHYNKQIEKINKNIDKFNQVIEEYEGHITYYKEKQSILKNNLNTEYTVNNSIKSASDVIAIYDKEIYKFDTEIQKIKINIGSMESDKEKMRWYRDKDAQAHAGSFVGINATDLVNILDFFDRYMDVKLVVISSCYAGGANASLALKDFKEGVQKKYKFTICFGTITEATHFSILNIDEKKTVCLDVDYNAFAKELFKASTVYSPIDIVKALGYIHPFYQNKKLIVGNVPLIKPAGGEWMQALRIEKKVASFGRILAQTCDTKKELNVRTFFEGSQKSTTGPEIITLFAEYVPCPLFCDSQLPSIVSEIVGPAVHIFDSIRAPKSTPEDAVKSFLSIDSLKEDKVFWVKKFELSGGLFEVFFSNSLKEPKRKALFFSIKSALPVAFELIFHDKDIFKTSVLNVAQTKEWYKHQIDAIQKTEKLSQLSISKKDLTTESIKKLKDVGGSFSGVHPEKVLKSQALYTEQLLIDFAKALNKIT